MAGDFPADGISVRDGFVPPRRVQELIDCAALRRAAGEFGPARIGAARVGGELAQRREDIRGDWTCWLTPPWRTAEQQVLRDFEQLRLDLNGQLLLGLFDLELHYAWYPPGTGYARHLDQPRGREERQVSLILYLNADWTPAAGGVLRLYDDAGRHRDIEPLPGRLVYFLSAGRAHEVLPTQAERLSLSGWFRRRPAGIGE